MNRSAVLVPAALRWAGIPLLGLVLLDVLVLDPMQTVTPDLPRLYSQLGVFGVAQVVSWAGCWFVLGVVALVATARSLERRPTLLAAQIATASGVLGGVLLTGLVLNTVLGIGFYMSAEDGGFAPPYGSAGAGLYVVFSLATALLVVAALCALVHLVGRSRR